MRLLRSMICAAVSMLAVGLLAVYTPRHVIETIQNLLIVCLVFGCGFSGLTMLFYSYFTYRENEEQEMKESKGD